MPAAIFHLAGRTRRRLPATIDEDCSASSCMDAMTRQQDREPGPSHFDDALLAQTSPLPGMTSLFSISKY
jgi:hypothetical protein